MIKQWTDWIRKIINYFGWQKYFEKDRKLMEAIGCLYVRENKKEKLYQLYYERTAIFSIVLIGIAVLALTCFVSEPSGNLKEGFYLEREEEREQELLVTMRGKEGETNIQAETKVKIRLPTRKLTEEEKKELSIQVKHYLDKEILGKNKGFHMVTSRLYFRKNIPDSDVGIEWFVDENYMTREGKLKRKNIPEEGRDTMVEAKASFRNWEETFSFSVFLSQGEMSPEELMTKVVKNGLKRSVSSQSTESIIKLPKTVEQVTLTYEETDNAKDFTPVMLGGLVPILLPFLWKEQQKKRLLQREKEMLLDHPGLIHQMMLLLSAGLTVRSAMERLVAEYEINIEKGRVKRYAYEELWVACNQMNNGVSEKKAIEEFGVRCRLMPYMRFAAIVSQNLKKGSGGLISLLEVDAMESFQRRKEMVKRLGEEAGTKMLFPMMVMLAIVMGILMIPAFMTL